MATNIVDLIASRFAPVTRLLSGQRPVYGPGGIQIGYWTPAELNAACRGNIYIYKDAPRPLPAPGSWYTTDDKGGSVFLGPYCLSKGITSPWMDDSPAASTFRVTTPSDRQAAADPLGTFVKEAAQVVPWYVWAGAGALILVSVLRR